MLRKVSSRLSRGVGIPATIRRGALPDHRELLEAGIEAAEAGGREILEIYGGSFEVELKADSSPVTVADRRSQTAILNVLRSRFPGIPVVSEEEGPADHAVRAAWPLHWLVDPLDGTKEFVARRPEFTVNVALIQGRYPLLGVVLVPADGTLYVGSPAGAARIRVGPNGGRTEDRLPLTPSMGPTITAAVSRTHLDLETTSYLARLESRGRAVHRVGTGSARKLCVVAEGTADVYPRFGPTMEWDTAAGQAVVEAAGGRMVAVPSGTRFVYGKPDLTNPSFVALAPGRDTGYFFADLPDRPQGSDS